MKFPWTKTETRAVEEPSAATSTATFGDELLKLLSPGSMNVSAALNIPAVSACVEFISSTIAMLPIKLYKEADGRTDEITDDERTRLLNDETGDLLDAYQMKRALIRDYLLAGSGYIYVNKDYSKAVSLHYVEKKYVSVYTGVDPIFKKAEICISGERYYPFQFLIMARNTVNGINGKGVVAENREILSAMYNAIVFEERLMAAGGAQKGFIEAEYKLDKEAMDELRKAWELMYSRYGNSAMILNKGLKFNPTASNAAELQMNEIKKINNSYICSIFNVSEGVISGKANEAEYLLTIKTGILPIIIELQTAVNRCLLLESEKDNMYFAVDTSELLKGDILKRYQAYRIALESNILQPDEIRYKEDMPPLGLDFIKMGLNDVLYFPNEKKIYTPNTNQYQDFANGNAVQGDKSDSNEEKDKRNLLTDEALKGIGV